MSVCYFVIFAIDMGSIQGVGRYRVRIHSKYLERTCLDEKILHFECACENGLSFNFVTSAINAAITAAVSHDSFSYTMKHLHPAAVTTYEAISQAA